MKLRDIQVAICQWCIDYCEKKQEKASRKAMNKKGISWRWYFWWERFWYYLGYKFL